MKKHAYNYNTATLLQDYDRLFSNVLPPVIFGDTKQNYPPHNICKITDTHYRIELAIVGLKKENIDIKLAEKILSIVHRKEQEPSQSSEIGYIHLGISTRNFELHFKLDDDLVVRDDVKLENGLLTIDLDLVVPESKKPKSFSIK